MSFVDGTNIPSWTEQSERELLTKLSREVPKKGTILEIGCLYGGTTAVLALSNPSAHITSMDDFSWTPEGYPEASQKLTERNLNDLSVKNVEILVGDSRKLCRDWTKPIDLLFIDGGHSKEYIMNDLFNFGRYAKVIACHDYKNPVWPTIEEAVEDFLFKNKQWHIDEVVGMIVVLRQK